MKISESTSYPHPVLAPWSDDIGGATIETTINFREDDENNQVSIHCEMRLDQPDIVALINSGAACFGCYVRCQETGMRRLQRIGFPAGTHDFASGALLGRVQIRPVVWAISSISGYKPTGVHSEFSAGSNIQPGQILALDFEQVIEVTRPPLASVESIFEIVAAEDLDEGEFEIDTDADRITVRMPEATYQLVQALRQTDARSRATIMNALYMPIVMDVLDQLREDTSQFEQYRWFHPFYARCQLCDVNLEQPDLMNDAQKLLDKPFTSLRVLVDEEA